MKSKLLSKVMNVVAIALLVSQVFPASSIQSIADTLDVDDSSSRVSLSAAELDNEEKPEFLTIQGEVIESEAEEAVEITLSGADFTASEQEEVLAEVPEATYKVHDNKLTLNVAKASAGKFSLKLQIVKDSIKDGEIQVTLGEQVLVVPVKTAEKEPEVETEEAEKTDEKEPATATVGNTVPRERGLGLNTILPTAAYPWNVVANSKVADPATDNVDNVFSPLPAVDDGRVWTDKTVNRLGGPTDFEVTLSALSQSVPTREGYQIPADTVFTIDVSGSMTQVDSGAGGRSRISLLVDALNEAIGILQDANPLNRIAVVAYGGRTGGYARVEKVLELGRYESNTSGNFFTVGSITEDENNDGRNETRPTVEVDAIAAGEGATSPAEPFIRVVGSTPTQWGIRESSRILEEAENKQVDVPVTDANGDILPEKAEVTRRPNMILLTDGEPTLGRPDYNFEDSAPVTLGPKGNKIQGNDAASAAIGPFYGDGSYGEQGLAVMTALTAAHRKTTIADSYFPGGNVTGDQGQPGASVGFFTISTGVQPTEAQRNLISATLNPVSANTDLILPNIRHSFVSNTTAAGPTATAPSMTTLLNNFATNGSTGEFLAQYRAGFGAANYLWNNALSRVNITNETASLAAPTDLAYADDFFEATNIDDLREAFKQITSSIQETSNKPIVDGEAEGDLGSDSLDFSDVLGDYMSFREVKSVRFADKGTFNLSATPPTDFNETLAEYVRAADGTDGVALNPASPEVQAILTTFANGRFTYYANTSGHYLGITNPGSAALKVEVYPFQQASIASEVSGGQESISRLFFSVNTALSDVNILTDYGIGEMGTRKLKQADQFVHWGIPSELLPMRTVSSNNGSSTVSGDKTPIQVKFDVALDEERLLKAFNEDRTSVPTNFWSNDWTSPAVENDSFATFEPSVDNPFYQDVEGNRVVNKTQNATGSDGWVSTQTLTPDPSPRVGEENIVVNLLGNNGTFALQYNGQVQIQKEFVFQDKDGNNINLTDLQTVLSNNELDIAAIQFNIQSTDLLPQTVGTATIDLNNPEVLAEAIANGGRVTLTLRDENGQPLNLQPGAYMVTESGGEIVTNPADYDYVHVPGATTQRVTVPPGGTGIASFVNMYARVAETELLRVQKVFHGLDAAALGLVSANFSVTITANQVFTGNDAATLAALGFAENADGFYEKTLSYDEAVAGVNFPEVPEGDYTITETGMDVDGYHHKLAHWRYIDLFNPANAKEADGTSGTVTIGEDSQIVFRFDNYYEPLGSIDLTKNFEGVTFERIPENFYIEITKADDPNFEPIKIERDDLTGLTTNQKISDLLPGEYTIKEYNFEVEGRNFEGNAQVERNLQVTPEGQQPTYKVTIPGLIGNNDVTVDIYNRYLEGASILPPVMVYPVQLRKVDQHEQGVAGAIFRLEKLNSQTNQWETYLDNLTSDAQGFVNTSVGEPGDYRFVETKAPDGFEMAENPISDVKTIVDGGVGTNDNPVDFGKIVNRMKNQIQLKKINEEGNPLAGAIFKVEFYNNGTWETIETGLTSTAEGLVTLDVDKDGRYRFIETQAPDDYILDATPKEVTVTMGEKPIFEAEPLRNVRDTTTDPDGPTDPNGPHTPSNSIQLLKVDEKNNALADAIFKVEAYNSEKQAWELLEEDLQSGADGRVTVSVPGPGSYRFIETQAPDGYILDVTPKEVSVEDDVTGVIDAGKLVNKSRDNLPIVGDNLGQWLLGLGLLSLFGASIVLIKKRKFNQ